ncbi:hypothetical protein N5H80_003580 [Salmonella enterica]|nr:hypothetical protein [Salmonella enterica]ECC3213860.1 hypothetical protein [Salmonella enterica subsp. diarizonae]EAA9598992.1 hypothetical protein [Salmonella enterica]EAM9431104.1 hypothetical protein [Salmonella enterica]EAN5735097.1 hypothetical protein [Salmonella enterica]
MKDDYHLPVITRLEREARRLGIKKAKLAMVLGLNEREYNYISDGWKVLSMSLLTPYVYNLFTSIRIDLFYVLTGVCGEGLCADCRKAFIQRWLNGLPPDERFRMQFFASRIQFNM